MPYMSSLTLLPYISSLTLLPYISSLTLLPYISSLTLLPYISSLTLLPYISSLTLYLATDLIVACLRSLTSPSTVNLVMNELDRTLCGTPWRSPGRA